MTFYRQSIARATGCASEDAAAIEEIMRRDVARSTLDGLSPRQFKQVAQKAAALLAAERATVAARQAELQRLAETPDAEALDALLADLTDPRTRVDAALALAELESDKAVGPLLCHIEDHRADVREAIVLALRRCSDARPANENTTAVALRAVLDPDEGVRLAAAETLGSYLRRNPHPTREAIAKAYDDIVRKHSDEPEDVSPRQSEDLIALADPELHPPLEAAQQLLRHLKNPRTSANAAEALAVRWQERAIEPLRDALDHPHPAVRAAGAEQLRRFPEPHISAAVAVRAVLDPDLRVRLCAARALHAHFDIPRQAPQDTRLRADAAIGAVSSVFTDIEHMRAADHALRGLRDDNEKPSRANSHRVIPPPAAVAPAPTRARRPAR